MDIVFDPQMTVGDMHALETIADQYRPQLAFEIGSWKGLSTWILARYAARLYCVDTWQAAPSTPNMAQEAAQRDIFQIFRQNMTQLNLMHVVKPMYMTSLEAAAVVKDNVADLVFIDADHAYSSIVQDIKAWWPKVKTGGILCGHDCEILYQDCNEDLKAGIERLKETDYIQRAISTDRGIHPGVTLAIHELFDDKVTTMVGSSIWFRQK